MNYPENLSNNNKIWYNRCLLYFHTCQKSKGFIGEFNWIRKELGLIKPPQMNIKEDSQ
jgi:hypothetical protein